MPTSDRFSPARRDPRRQIEELIRHGLLSLDEIAAEVVLSCDAPLDASVVRSLVDDAWQRTSPPEPPRPTPLDRLQAAFDALDQAGIMARHYPTAGRSQAEAQIHDELGVAKHQGKAYRGYCFHDQHAVRLMFEDALAFCFGPAEVPTSYAQLWGEQTKVGTAIAGALEDAGFTVDWSGRPADVIHVAGVVWSGPRDQAGEPLVATGPRLAGKSRPRRGRAAGRAPSTNVFVSCPAGEPDAHRLIAAIASQTGNVMYGGADAFHSLPAAVAVTIPRGSVLDFVAGESEPGPRGLMRRRDLANECSFLVAMAPTAGELESTWWSMFPPARRILVVTRAGESPLHDGSPVHCLDLVSGEGVTALLEAVSSAALVLSGDVVPARRQPAPR